MLDLAHLTVKYSTDDGANKGILEVFDGLIRPKHTVGAEKYAVEVSCIEYTGTHMLKGILTAKGIGDVCHRLLFILGKCGGYLTVFDEIATTVAKPHANEAVAIEHRSSKSCAVGFGGILLE